MIPKHVLFIASFPPPYHGSNIDNQHLFDYWKSPLINIILFNISHNKEGGSIGTFTIENVLVTIKNSMRLFFHLFSNKRYDFILLNLSQGLVGFLRDSLFIILGKIIFKTKIILRFPGGDFYKFYKNSGFFNKYIKHILNISDLIITEGVHINYQFKLIVESIPVISAHIGIPDPTDKMKSVDDSYCHILYIIGVHRTEKGFWDVLESIPRVVEKNPLVKYDFVGYIPESLISKRKVDEFISKHKISNWIIFHGIKYGEEKYKIYKKSNFMILPSYSEGFPTSILEGLAFSLPVIASNVGVIPEIINNHKNGFLMEPGDIEELISRIIELSMNPDLMVKMGKINREYFLAEFTIDKFCKKIEKAILSV